MKRMRTRFPSLSIACYFSILLQRDLDRGLKILLDARCNGLGANDTRVVELHLSKRIRPQDPHVYKETE